MKTVIDLNGTWDFVPDLDPKYYTINGGFHRTDADRRHWLNVPVPHRDLMTAIIATATIVRRLPTSSRAASMAFIVLSPIAT